MAAPLDAVAKIDELAIEEEREGAANKRNGINAEHDDIAADRRSLQEISNMADRIAGVLQEVRNNNVEAESRLRRVEDDLILIELEIGNGKVSEG